MTQDANEQRLLDILDDKGRHLGVAEHEVAHRVGLWHQVFTCIVVLKDTEALLLQKKAPGSYSFDRPDYLDVSVGGHLKAGEPPSSGVREIEEELGLRVRFEDLISLGIRQTAATVAPDYIANEFQHIYLYGSEASLPAIPLPGGEVTGVVAVPIRTGIELLLGRLDHLVVTGLFLDGEVRRQEQLRISRSDFVPAYLELDQLFLRLFVAARRYLDGERPEELFW